MLTSIVKATRAHYAALQHRAAPDRVPLHYTVWAKASTCASVLTSGTIQVKMSFRPGSRLANGRRKAEMTKLANRLRTMFPESTEISVRYE